MLGHEVDGFRGDLVGGHDEVTLVLAVLVVDDDQHPPLPDLLDPFFDRGEARHDVSLLTRTAVSSSDRSTYFPITSASMFTATPRSSRPRVVTSSVCGISITS